MKKSKKIFLLIFAVLMIVVFVVLYINSDKISLKYHLHRTKTGNTGDGSGNTGDGSMC